VPSSCELKLKKFVSAKIGSSVAVVIELEPIMLLRVLDRNRTLAVSRKAGWMSGS